MGLPPLIEALLDPSSYPAPPPTVSLRQTHISYILLAAEFAYKIKKPVDFGFLDFTTLDKRRFFCDEEVRLNKRLAPGIYLGVVPITKKDGGFRMEGAGEPVEYAVKMKRLSEDSILVRALERDEVSKDTIARIARVIAGFHKTAATDGRISSFGSPALIKKNTDENFIQTRAFIGHAISKRLYGRIKEYTDGFLSRNERLFIKRSGAGFIRDCHGDIHCEHISIADGINIFDCIEFNERFRFSDVAADAAFLSMDLDFRNRADLARLFETIYFKASGDTDGAGVLDFYKCYRAYVRGKVEGFKSMEPEVGWEERSLALLNARRHFHLSGLYSSGGFRPSLVVVCGLSGTGKSTVACLIAGKTGFVRLSSDALRKELAGVEPSAHRFEDYGKGIYSDEFTERTYGGLIERALSYLKEGRSVVLDATFSRRRFIDAAKEASAQSGAEFNIVECVADGETVKKRLLKRRTEEVKGAEAVSDADWGVYLRQKAAFEPIEGPRIVLSPELPMERRMDMVFEKIFG
ncbi:MAG: AAA family ATPase [Deltaproteobacteria bacterium]|nr:AAA family ATPase [Deltaproteobacteria bacterium]